jgi:hypothetical protein
MVREKALEDSLTSQTQSNKRLQRTRLGAAVIE